MKFLQVIVCILLAACASQPVEAPLEAHKQPIQPPKIDKSDYYPTVMELLTMGIVSDKNADIKAYREEQYKLKYVSDENDDRSFLGKTVSAFTLGIVNGRETKKQRAERLAKETQEKELIEQEEQAALLAEEAQKNQQPEPEYSANAVMPNEWLGQLEYGNSTYSDTVALLGNPIRLTIQPNGEKQGLFKVNDATYKLLPYIGSPQINARLNFNKNNILVQK